MRELSVYACKDYVGFESIKSTICITRSGFRGIKPFSETGYYASNIILNAQEFGDIIRGHWEIENKLHWVKDVVLQEDKSSIKGLKVSQSMSIIRNFVVSNYYNKGYKSITKAIRKVSNSITDLVAILNE